MTKYRLYLDNGTYLHSETEDINLHQHMLETLHEVGIHATEERIKDRD